MWTIVWLMTLVFGGHDGKEPTDRLIPEHWHGNPWGPEATRARETGEIPPVPLTPLMKQWDAWGKTVLRDGDILFRRGDAKLLAGHFPFSKFLARVSGSRFSHTGIVAIEEGEPVVYDTTKAGVRRQPFHIWILDNAGPFAVKRVRPADQPYTAKAVQYCRDLFARQLPFDYDLSIDDRAFYCVEMTEKAYRANGLPLSEPVRLGDMENITKYPICVLVFLKISNLSLDQPVYFPGNERHGIWSCPRLMTIYESKLTPDERRGMFGH
jgi:Permuted papain-like amidase enzyme, YaeF/YiiX, C92 family